jgi:hypothetical protein
VQPSKYFWLGKDLMNMCVKCEEVLNYFAQAKPKKKFDWNQLCKVIINKLRAES